MEKRLASNDKEADVGVYLSKYGEHTSFRRTALCNTLNCILLCTLLSLVFFLPANATENGDHLSGAHVCSRQVYESGYYTVNVSYACWTDHHNNECRPSRRNHACSDFSTCFRSLTRCETRWVTKKFCCPGYEENGYGGCQEAIECNDDNGGCEHLCKHDGSGNQICECFPGYTLQGRTQCVDVDECSTTHKGGCNQQCTNQQGGYFCSCNIGYRLASPTRCEEIDECAYGNGGCEHNCHNTDGAFYCECDAGYVRVKGFMCALMSTKKTTPVLHTTPTIARTTTLFREPLNPDLTPTMPDIDFDDVDGDDDEGVLVDRQVSAGEDTGALAGIVVGSIVGAALFIAALVLLVLLVRRYGCCCCCCCTPLVAVGAPPPYSEADPVIGGLKTTPAFNNVTYGDKKPSVINEKDADGYEHAYDHVGYNNANEEDIYDDVIYRGGRPIYDNPKSLIPTEPVYNNTLETPPDMAQKSPPGAPPVPVKPKTPSSIPSSHNVLGGDIINARQALKPVSKE